MIYLLNYERISQDIIDACGSYAIANILSITKTIVNLIQLLGPIICMVALAINFTKLMSNPDEKKYKPIIKNCIIALIILFMVPFIINLTMRLADESFDLAKCWNNAEEVANAGENSEYVETTEKPRKPVIVEPGNNNNP